MACDAFINVSVMSVNGNGTLEPRQAGDMTSYPSSALIQLLRRCNAFYVQGLSSIQGECRPLVACGRQVGVIRPDVASYLLDYPQVFIATPDRFILNPQLDSFNARSNAVEMVLRDLREKNVLSALRGWREECFNVWADYGAEPVFKIERSAATLFGVRSYGVHITGFFRQNDGTMMVWIQKRSVDKPTWPGMLDTMVGGGLTAGFSPSQVMLKEAEEEASVPENLALTAKAVGTVSFFCETDRGVHANTEFVYDLELPSDFTPTNSDGEVEGFEAVPVKELIDRVLSSKYKLTSVPVAINFLVRHGLITPDMEPEFPTLMELLHVPLNQLFLRWLPSHSPSNSPPI